MINSLRKLGCLCHSDIKGFFSPEFFQWASQGRKRAILSVWPWSAFDEDCSPPHGTCDWWCLSLRGDFTSLNRYRGWRTGSDSYIIVISRQDCVCWAGAQCGCTDVTQGRQNPWAWLVGDWEWHLCYCRQHLPSADSQGWCWGAVQWGCEQQQETLRRQLPVLFSWGRGADPQHWAVLRKCDHMREAKDTKRKDLTNGLSARCGFGTFSGFPDHLLEPYSRALLVTSPSPQSRCVKKPRGTRKHVTPTPIRTGNIDPPVPGQTVAHFSLGTCLKHVWITL